MGPQDGHGREGTRSSSIPCSCARGGQTKVSSLLRTQEAMRNHCNSLLHPGKRLRDGCSPTGPRDRSRGLGGPQDILQTPHSATAPALPCGPCGCVGGHQGPGRSQLPPGMEGTDRGARQQGCTVRVLQGKGFPPKSIRSPLRIRSKIIKLALGFTDMFPESRKPFQESQYSNHHSVGRADFFY